MKPQNVDDYIARFPEGVRERLEKIRATVRKAAPQAEEALSYQIPTFKLEGNLVHFAAFERHIGFYPGASGVAKFKTKLAGFKSAKGSIQFPLNRAVPYGLIREVVAFRVKENLARAEKKGGAGTAPPGSPGGGSMGQRGARGRPPGS